MIHCSAQVVTDFIPVVTGRVVVTSAVTHTLFISDHLNLPGNLVSNFVTNLAYHPFKLHMDLKVQKSNRLRKTKIGRHFGGITETQSTL